MQIAVICGITPEAAEFLKRAVKNDHDSLIANVSLGRALAGAGRYSEALKALRQGIKPAELKGVADNQMIDRLSRNPEFDGWIKDFLQ